MNPKNTHEPIPAQNETLVVLSGDEMCRSNFYTNHESGKNQTASSKRQFSTSTLWMYLCFMVLLLFSKNVSAQCTITGAQQVCPNSTKVYSVSVPNAVSWQWSVNGGNITSSSNGSASVNWGTLTGGTVSVTALNAQNVVLQSCTSNVQIESTVEPVMTTSHDSKCVMYEDREGKFEPAIVQDDCWHVCEHSYVLYNVNNPAPGSTYIWTVSGAQSYSSNNTSASVNWGAMGNGQVTVTETTVGGCVKISTKCVKIDESPRVFIQSMPNADCREGIKAEICLGQSMPFTGIALLGNTNSPIVSWHWDFGDGNTSNLQNPTYTWTNGGSYDVTLTVTNACNCSASCRVTVNVNDVPGAIIECATPVCENGVDSYTAYNICGNVYAWSVSNGTILSPPPYGSTIQVQWNNNGSGNGMVCIDNNAAECDGICNSTACIEIPIVSLQSYITGPITACVGSQVEYSVPAMTGCVYTWTVTGGAVSFGQGTPKILVTWNSAGAGTVHVDYYNEFLDCGGVADLNVDISTPFEIIVPDNICIGSTVNLQIGNVLGGSFFWYAVNSSGNITYLGSCNFFTNYTLTIPWNLPAGPYTIKAVANNSLHCNTVATKGVNVKNPPAAPASPLGNSPVCPNSSHLYTGIAGNPGNFLEWSTLPLGLNPPTTPQTGNGSQFSVTWGAQPATGNYTIRLREVDQVTGCTSAWTSKSVAPRKYVAPVITGNMVPCINSTQTYIISNITTYEFDQIEWVIFPETAGSVIAGQGSPNVTVLWNNTPGPARLAIKTRLCNTDYPAFPASNNINITGSPFIAISPANATVCEGVPVNFSVTGTGVPGTWVFSDGNNNPSGHIFSTSNSTVTTYSINVTVNDNGCIATTSTSVTVNPKPDAIVSVNPSFICPALGVYSSDLSVIVNSTGNSFLWHHNSTTAQFVTVQNPGTYDVTVTNQFGCNILLKPKVLGCPDVCPVDPDISVLNFSSVTSCNSVTYTPSLTSSGTTITGYKWSFGDGATQTGSGSPSPVSHAYTHAGYYDVCLTVFSTNNGIDYCTPICHTVTVHAKMNFFAKLVCNNNSGYDVQFYDLSSYYTTPGPTNLTWSGGGFSGTGHNPVWTLATPGTHSITLTYNDGFGVVCTVAKSIVVPDLPSAQMTVSGGPFCEKQTVVYFTTPANNTVINAFWNFGDAASYQKNFPQGPITSNRVYENALNSPFNVTLTLTDQFGCTVSSNALVNLNQNNLSGTVVPSTAKFCPGAGQVISYQPAPSSGTPSAYLWTNSAITPSIQVSTTGSHNVTVSQASTGCSFTPLVAANALVYNVPDPKITGSLVICEGDDISLNGFSGTAGQGTPAYVYTWTNNAFLQNTSLVNHLFTSPSPVAGTYWINLEIKATDPVTMVQCTRNATVQLLVHPRPAIPQITSNPPNTCAGTWIDLTVNNQGSNWVNWSTGATGSQISVINSGIYQATFTDFNGCTSEASHVVYPMPYTGFMMTGCVDFCDKDDIIIPGSGNLSYYKWDWFVNGQHYGGGQGPVANLDLTNIIGLGFYTVTLELSVIYPDGTVCTITTDPLDITVVSCDCRFEPEVEVRCVQESTEAHPYSYYHFTMNIPRLCDEKSQVIITSPQGTVTLSNTSNPPYFYEGIIKTLLKHPDAFCFKIQIISLENPDCNCLMEYCIDLPKCDGPSGCHVEADLIEFKCAGFTASGLPIYNVNLNINVQNSSYVIITSPSGTINPNSFAVNPNQNIYPITFTSYIWEQTWHCFTITTFDYLTGEICEEKEICFDIPFCHQNERSASSSLSADKNGKAKKELSFTLVPNPVSDYSEINWLGSDASSELTIVDIRGSVMLKTKLEGSKGSFRIATSAWLPGIYFVTVQSGPGQKTTRKMVVIK